MAEANEIWESAFWDWKLLSHPAKSLPIDDHISNAIRKLITETQPAKLLSDAVDRMLNSALDPHLQDDIYKSVSDRLAQTLCASKEMRRLFKRKYGVDIIAPDFENRNFTEFALSGIKAKAEEIFGELAESYRAIIRFLVDFAPSFASNKLLVREINKPKFQPDSSPLVVSDTFRSIIIIKDRNLFDIIEEGQFSARNLRREIPIILLIRGNPIGISAIAFQMDGDTLNAADWCSFPVGDADIFLSQMPSNSRETHFFANADLEDYVEGLITSYDLASNLPNESSHLEKPDPVPNSDSLTSAYTQWTTPTSALAPQRPKEPTLENQIRDRIEPILLQLASAEKRIEQLQIENARISREADENERILALQSQMERERDEFSELLRIAEIEKIDAISEAAALRSALRARSMRSSSNKHKAIAFPASLADIEPWANEHLIGRVHILPRAYRTMRKVVFSDVERACRALLLLAGPYLDARLGVEGANAKFIDGLKELRLIDKPQPPMGGSIQNAELHINYHGEKIFLDKHIRGKESRHNDEKLLRIYYHFHAATAQILIGHMPTHLTTQAS